MPEVSIIIPTYNHGRYILETLASVFGQTFTDYEIIVVNDGSPDDTAEVLQPLAQSGRIRYFEQKNQGQAAARNRGLVEARGEFIAFLDDDDLWPPEKLQWQVDLLRHRPDAGAVGGSCEFIDDSGRTTNTNHIAAQSISFESLFEGNPFWSPGQLMIRVSAIRSVGGFDPCIRGGADDLDLLFRLARSSVILACDTVALKYRQHATNSSKNLLGMLRSCRQVINRHLKSLPPDSRRGCRQAADKFLYGYVGFRFFAGIKKGLRSLRIIAAGRSLLGVSYFLASLIRTPELRSRAWRDMAPGFLRKSRAAQP